jgi:hypothetical protein
MYIDKPMKDHNLMQAIARVGRVFKDKPGGLVVDYIGIANDLKRALQEYTESKGTGKLKERNLAVEVLERLFLKGGIKSRLGSNVVQSHKFSEPLQNPLTVAALPILLTCYTIYAISAKGFMCQEYLKPRKFQLRRLCWM